MFVAYAIMFCLAFTVAVLSAPLVRALAIRIGALLLGVQFLGARALLRFVSETLGALSSRRVASWPARDTTVLWLRRSQSLNDVSLALRPWLCSVRASCAYIRSGEPAGWVLLKIQLRDRIPASHGSLACPILLTSGKKLVLTVEGTSTPGIEVPSAIREALAHTLARFEKQGIRDASAAFAAATRLSQTVAAR